MYVLHYIVYWKIWRIFISIIEFFNINFVYLLKKNYDFFYYGIVKTLSQFFIFIL